MLFSNPVSVYFLGRVVRGQCGDLAFQAASLSPPERGAESSPSTWLTTPLPPGRGRPGRARGSGSTLGLQAGWWWGLLGLLTALSPQAERGWQPPERWCEQLFTSVVPVLLGGPEEEPGGRQLLDLDCFLSDISDTLFTMTQPSPTPLQLPPEDGEGLHQGREA